MFPAEQVVDVHFSEFVADPLATIGQLYGALGRPLTDETEDRMRRFLAEHPGDGGGGGHRYRFSDTGLDADGPPRAGRGLPAALRRGVRAAALTVRSQ